MCSQPMLRPKKKCGAVSVFETSPSQSKGMMCLYAQYCVRFACPPMNALSTNNAAIAETLTEDRPGVSRSKGKGVSLLAKTLDQSVENFVH